MTIIRICPDSQSFFDRFWSKVDKTPFCWVWRGGFKQHPRTGESTYGTIFATGKVRCAHRVSWEIEYGPIPVGMNVLHRCDNPACVKPEHLFLGTQADNIIDMHQKGRALKAIGGRNRSAKLTDEDVLKIRREYVARGSSTGYGNASQLAEQYGVCKNTIIRVAKRKNWGHVA